MPSGVRGTPGFGRSGHCAVRETLITHRIIASLCICPPFNLPPEQEAQLSQIATKAGTDAERLVKDAALRLLQEDARFRAAVREGIAQADRGEFIEEEEMDARLEQMLRS